MPHQSDLIYWLALARLPKVNGHILNRIIKLYPNVKDFYQLQPGDYQQLKLDPVTIAAIKAPDFKAIELDLLWQDRQEIHHIITQKDDQYPLLLKEIPSPPLVLFVKGQLSILNQQQIAIVGSRLPTPGGKKAAFQFAAELAKHRFVITSGLALGIDQAAHEGALSEGISIAVVATGLNLCYPSKNLALAEKISQQGALVSEYSFNTSPKAYHFPQRNRLISGLSLGTLVVEAHLKSGSLITAGFALEQGRDVFAIPGSIFNPKTRGCHQLLKQGAVLVEDVQDIFNELSYFGTNLSSKETSQSLTQKILEDNHAMLLECIGYEPTKIDVLVACSQFSISTITSILADLELAGYICSSVYGYMRVSL